MEAMSNYNNMKSNSKIQNKMSGSKKRMSMSNLLMNEDHMNFASNQNNNFRMNNYQSHKPQNYSMGQGGMPNNRAYNKSQRELHMFNQSRMMKSPSSRKLMKNDSSLFINREKSRTKKSPRKKKSKSLTE